MKYLLEGKMKKLLLLPLFVFFTCQLTFSQDTTWKVFTPANSGLPNLPLSSVAIDNNDIKWIVAAANLIRFDWNNWEVFDSSNSILPNVWWNVVITRGGNGNAWVGGYVHFGEYNVGLVNVSSTPWTAYDTLNSSLAYNDISGLSPSREGGAWIISWPGVLGGPGTLQKFSNSIWYNSPQQPYTFSKEIEEDLYGNVWYTLDFPSGGVHKIAGDTTYSYHFWSGAAQSIETDLNGNVWMSWYTIPPDTSGLIMYDGTNWVVYNQGNSGLPAEHVWNLVTDSIGNLWMSGDGLIKFDGIIFTYYTPANSGLYSTDIRDIQIDDANNKWIIHPDAISVFNEDGITSVTEELQLPNAFKLHQNYPNPFNPVTNIQYQIVKPGFVSLKVYDVLGNEIATLVNEEKPSGSYEVEFSTGLIHQTLSSGIYFYQLRAGDFVETKKMVLLR